MTIQTNLNDGNRCPLCMKENWKTKGNIRHFQPEEVGGVNINPDGVIFQLRACEECGFTWKAPPLDQELLLRGYSQSPADHWSAVEDGRERQFDYMEQLLCSRILGNAILDVGCFNGELLRHFGTRWKHYGVEPSVMAAEVSRTKGIEILGPTIDSLDPEKHSFDGIIAVDVVEHLPAPREFFERAASLLKPGGVLLCVTGDTDARTWRIYGSHYWYCSYIGHISFLNRRSVEWVGNKCGLKVVHYERRPHLRSGVARHLKDWIKNARYAVASHLPLFPSAWSDQVPHWISAHDHMFAMLQKK